MIEADFSVPLLPTSERRISGIELQRRLAASGSKCPVIFMTANDDEATRNEAVDAGCVAYLRKPFARQVLLDAIGNAVT
jgi:FixJ family two-component response regulator